LKGFTLLELLRFYAEVYVRLSKELLDFQLSLQIEEGKNPVAPGEEWTLPKDLLEHASWVLGIAKDDCEKIGLQVCSRHVNELLVCVQIGALTSEQVKALHENIERELSCQFFVGISQDHKAAFCESLKGWEDIAKAFPRSIDDIEEMNKCFALCRCSAAVFHSLLVVEYGLVRLGELLGVTDPKEGWDASCRKLQNIVDAGYKANTTGLNFEFLAQLNACIQTMKLAWRNKINHATGKVVVMSGGFAPYVAEEIIMATRSFMRRLAEGIK
jgi:hypothetical protein